MKKQSLQFLTLLAATAVLLAGCNTTTTVSRIPAYSAVKLEAGLSPQDQERVDVNCLFGLPKRDAHVNFGPTDLVARDGYVLMHSAVDKIPVFVCEHVTAAQLNGSLTREDNPFKADSMLQAGRRA